MSTTEWLVIGGGVAVIILLNWYFFFAERGQPKSGQANAGSNDVKPPRTGT